MDSRALIELQRLPFKARLDEQYRMYEEELKRGFLMGREGDGAATPIQPYKDLFGGGFREVLNFGTNNYLGLSTHPYVREKVCEAVQVYGVGTGGSPAFSGYTRHHRELEARLATLAGHEAALLLPSGFMANLCWVNGLTRRQDVLLYDKHSHASVINAIKMAGVPFYSFDPDDLPAFEALLGTVAARRAENSQIFATVEGVRSIDGSVVNLPAWLDICRRHGVVTVLDDAHGLGTVGKTGKGTLEYLDLLGQVDFRMSTCSKAIGAQGAFLSGSAKAIFYLRTLANPYVFTTALAHPTVAAISAALDVLERDADLVARLHRNVEHLRGRVEALGHRVGHSPGGIVPVYLPDGVAREFNRGLFQAGLFAHVMEYPMVPPGMERVRLTVMATHTPEQLDRAVEILAAVSKRFGLPR
jgi:glycine C-acetyltransferase